MFLKFLFCTDFIESDLTRIDAVAGVSDTAVFQNFLKLAILAKSSVDCIERQLDIVRKLELFAAHINFYDIGP